MPKPALPLPANWSNAARFVQHRLDAAGPLAGLMKLQPGPFANALLAHLTDPNRPGAIYHKDRLQPTAALATQLHAEQARWDQEVAMLALEHIVPAASNPYGTTKETLREGFDFNSRHYPDPESIHGLNRCRWFIALARAYWQNQDPAYFEALMWHWDFYARHVGDPDASTIAQLQAIGPGAGRPAPWHSLNSFIRLTSWWHAFWLSIHAREMTPQQLVVLLSHSLKLLDYVHAHGVRMQEHNFTSMQMQGLYYWAISLPEWSGMHTLATMARNSTEYSLHRALLPDGLQWETSLSYHIGCIAWYGGPALLGQRLGQPWNDTYLDLLSKMGDITDQCIEPDGQVYLMSDTDRKSNWRLGLGLLGQLFPKKTFMHKTTPDLETIWLCEGQVNVSPRSRKAKPGAVVFPHAGLAVARSAGKPESVLFLDNGPSNAGHAHMDQLSIYWTVEGELTLVDPGRYIYKNDDNRAWIRSMQAHNSVWFNPEKSPVVSAASRVPPGDPRIEPIVIQEGDGIVHLTTTFKAYAGDPTAWATRRVTFPLTKEANWLLVVDRFESREKQAWNNSWLTPGDQKAVCRDGRFEVRLQSGKTLSCVFTADHAVKCASEQRFWTPDYAMMDPAQWTRIAGHTRAGLRAHLLTTLPTRQMSIKLSKTGKVTAKLNGANLL